MFNFAIERGIVEASPCVRLQTHREAPRERVLSDTRSVLLWLNLEAAEMSPRVRLALKLVLVTGQRPGEVAGMTVDELDEDGTTWTIPTARMKGRHLGAAPHVVPLSDFAQKIIEAARERRQKTAPRARGRRSPKTIRNPVCSPGPQARYSPKAPSRTPCAAMPWLSASSRSDHTICAALRDQSSPRSASVNISASASSAISSRAWRASTTSTLYGVEKRKALETWARRLKTIVSGKAAGNVVMIR